MKNSRILQLALVMLFALSACQPVAATAAPAVATEAPVAEVATTEAPAVAMMDIVDTAVAAGSFNRLVAAVQAAELVDTLKGEGPFTVFAPSDEAFAALPEGRVASLLEDPKGALTNILLYHVVSGKVMAADVLGMDGKEVETVGGGKFTIMLDGDKVRLKDAAGTMIPVSSTDIEASNGVIHVIDGILMPK